MKLVYAQPRNHSEILSLIASHNPVCGTWYVDFDRAASRSSLTRDQAVVVTSKPESDIRYEQSVDGGFMQAVNPLSKRQPTSLIA